MEKGIKMGNINKHDLLDNNLSKRGIQSNPVRTVVKLQVILARGKRWEPLH